MSNINNKNTWKELKEEVLDLTLWNKTELTKKDKKRFNDENIHDAVVYCLNDTSDEEGVVSEKQLFKKIVSFRKEEIWKEIGKNFDLFTDIIERSNDDELDYFLQTMPDNFHFSDKHLGYVESCLENTYGVLEKLPILFKYNIFPVFKDLDNIINGRLSFDEGDYNNWIIEKGLMNFNNFYNQMKKKYSIENILEKLLVPYFMDTGYLDIGFEQKISKVFTTFKNLEIKHPELFSEIKKYSDVFWCSSQSGLYLRMLAKANVYPDDTIKVSKINDISEYYFFGGDKIPCKLNSKRKDESMSWLSYFNCYSEGYNKNECNDMFNFIKLSEAQKKLFIEDMTNKNKYFLHKQLECAFDKVFDLLKDKNVDFIKQYNELNNKSKNSTNKKENTKSSNSKNNKNKNNKKNKHSLLEILFLNNSEKDDNKLIILSEKMDRFVKDNLTFFKENEKCFFNFNKDYKIEKKVMTGSKYKALLDKLYIESYVDASTKSTRKRKSKI